MKKAYLLEILLEPFKIFYHFILLFVCCIDGKNFLFVRYNFYEIIEIFGSHGISRIGQRYFSRKRMDWSNVCAMLKNKVFIYL